MENRSQGWQNLGLSTQILLRLKMKFLSFTANRFFNVILSYHQQFQSINIPTHFSSPQPPKSLIPNTEAITYRFFPSLSITTKKK